MQSLKVLHTRLRCSGLPSEASHKISGIGKHHTASPTKSVHPIPHRSLRHIGQKVLEIAVRGTHKIRSGNLSFKRCVIPSAELHPTADLPEVDIRPMADRALDAECEGCNKDFPR